MKKFLILLVSLAAFSLAEARPPALPAGQPDGRQSERRQRRAHERELRQQRFTMRLDSLVSSGEFQFLPISMEQVPDGSLQMINNFYYYVGVYRTQQLEVHLPIMRGDVIEYPAIANFDTDQIFDFQTSRTKYGWEASFSAKDDKGTVYTFNFNVYTATGEAILNLMTEKHSIKYIGSVVPNDAIEGIS